MKVAFDVGGVISKYPDTFRELIVVLRMVNTIDVFVISDMHPKEKIVEVLKLNNIPVRDSNVYSADYDKHGEFCKAWLCRSLDIDILVDDFVGYVADGSHIRMLVMPDSTKPYWSNKWKTTSDSNFGRRHYNNKVERSCLNRLDKD